MKHMKRGLSWLLVLCMLLSMLSLSAFAEEETDATPTEEAAAETVTEEPSSEAGSTAETPVAAEENFAEELITVEDPAMLATGTKPSNGTTSNQPYISNTTGGSQYFRIPAMVTLDNGTIVTAADARWNGTGDGGGNDTVVSYSTNGGSTWNYTFANYLGDNGNSYNGASTCFIDPALATDGSTVYMLVDLWPAGYALNSANNTPVAGANGFDSNGRLRLSGDNRSSYGYYLSNGTIYSTSGTAVSGLSVDSYYNVTGTYNGTTYNTNLFCADSPFLVYPTNYLWLTKSTDGGANWGAPTLINVKKSAEQSCLVGPGTGIVTSTGRIIYTVYNYTSGDKNTSVIYSDDKGATWTRSDDMNAQSSEATLTEVKVGSTNYLYMFTRHGGYYTSTDDGTTWSNQKSVSGISYYTGCQLHVITYSKTIDGKPAILLSAPGSTSGRTNGKIFVGLIQDDGSISWDYTYSVNSGTYQYSCLTELSDGSIGLLYENGSASITYTNLDISTIASGATIGSSDSSSSESGSESGSSESGSESGSSESGSGSSESSGTASETDKTITTTTTEGGTVYQLDSDGIDVGETYVIYSATGSRILYASSSGSTTDQVTAPSVSTEKDGLITLNTGFDASTQLWTVTSNGIQSQASSKYLYLKNTSTSGIPLQSSSGNSTKVEFTQSGNGYLVKMNSNSSTRYLYNTGSKFGVTNSSSSATVFYFYKKTTTEGSITYTADNSKLLELIATANALTEGDYTSASWDDLQTALTAANSIGTPVAQDTETAAQDDQDKINTAAKNLNAAIKALVKVQNISVVVGNTVTVENLTGTLDTSSLDTTIATASLSNGTLTVTGVKAGLTSVTVGDKVYNITVKPATVDVDINYTPFIVGTNSITTGAGEKLTKLSTSVGTSYDIDLGTDYASSSATWSMADTSIATVDSNGKVTGVAAGETTLYCTINGTTYAMPIVVYNTGSSSASSTKICSLHTTEITNTEVWYSWNLLTGNDNMPTTMIKAVAGEAIYVAFPSGDAYCINYYGAPDDGYALTYMLATNSSGQYLAIDDKDDITQCDWYANSGACYNERSNQTYISSSSTRLTTIQNEIKTAINTAKAYTAEGVSAAGLSADGAQGFSRGTSGTDNTNCDLTFRSEKLPTVTKTITGIKRSGESTVTAYTEGMTAAKDDQVYFKVSVKQYATTEAIVYTSDTLTENLSGATFVSNSGTTVSGMLNDSTLTADTTYEYDVVYTIKDSDLDKDIENTVDLTYNYSSTYSSGTFAGSAEASAKISAPTFTPDDIVIDFGLPVTVDYSGTDAHGRYDLASGTATYGDVTVSGNKVTYTPNKVLTGIDTVTLTNSAGGTSTFKVYPATTVYYEEGFATYTGWTNTDNKGTANQTATATSVDDQYGYDAAYVTETVDKSSGTAATTSTKGAVATFTFTGTGFDVYANCDSDSGVAVVRLYQGDTIVSIARVETTSNSDLYNISGNEYGLPIYSVDNLTWGTYTVKVVNNSTDSKAIEIDGFRVYNTLEDASNSVYKADTEDNPGFMEVRDMVLAAAEITTDSEGQVHASVPKSIVDSEEVDLSTTEINGVILSKDTSIASNLLNNGPKNEMFLVPGDTVVLKVTTSREVQIGLKAVNGSAEVTGSYSGTISSSVDMFYTVSGGTITITNSADSTGVLSITKLKVCDDPEFSLAALTQEDIEQAVNGNECTHTNTEVRDAAAATCTTDGYTGDTYCTDCGEQIATGETIAATGHNYVDGKCAVCGEADPDAVPTVKVPTCTVSAAQGTASRKIKITGTLNDYANLADYNITGHGILYITASRLGSKDLTVDTTGRTKVSFSAYNDDGSFSYTFRAGSNTTKYVVRAWISCTDSEGNTVYVYSKPLTVSYDSLG